MPRGLSRGFRAPAVPAIKPPTLAQEKVTVMLPGPITNLAVGGGGRYLLLYIPEVRKLGVFDVNEAKIRKYLDVPGDGFKFAAGRKDLVLFLPESKTLKRWDLATLEREASVPAPLDPDPSLPKDFKVTVDGLVMGSASSGPLLLQRAAYRYESNQQVYYEFRDVRTLKTCAQVQSRRRSMSLPATTFPSTRRPTARFLRRPVATSSPWFSRATRPSSIK